jgi:2-polyprenyl-6-methoxyphenol hydroxylase-like FAD-dependent oxidoreductase
VKLSKAIVVGSGIGGLVTAAVLSKHFEQVVLIDRDDIPATAEVRNGVPQGNHFHGVLPGGVEVLAALFPGFEDDLKKAGSLTPSPSEFYAFTPAGKSYSTMSYQPKPSQPLPGFPSTYIQTRPLLERCVRNRIESIDNITTLYNTMVKDLAVDNKRVVGVKLEESGETIACDLVIDATGRVSRTIGWLSEMGFDAPLESTINCDFAYTTTFFTPNDPTKFTDVGFFMAGDPNGDHPKRGGALIRMEDGTLLATIGGRLGDYPPKSLEGFYEYAETLIEPSFYELIKDATPASEPHHFMFPRSIRRHYDRLTNFPEGLLPTADAISHNNPVYGQGMSAACKIAVALGEIIEKNLNEKGSLDGIWQPFLKEAHEQTRAPWLFAALADFSEEGTTGDFPDDEQTSIEVLMNLRQAADNGSTEAETIFALIAGMREPLRILHTEKTKAALASAAAEA